MNVDVHSNRCVRSITKQCKGQVLRDHHLVDHSSYYRLTQVIFSTVAENTAEHCLKILVLSHFIVISRSPLLLSIHVSVFAYMLSDM